MAVRVFDRVQEARNVGAFYVHEDALAPVRQHVLFQHALHLVAGAQALGLDVPRKPVLGDRREAVWLHRRRLEGR